MTRTTVTAGAAAAFVVQSAALVTGALWAGFRLGRFSASLVATTPPAAAPPSGPTLRVVNAEEVPQ